MKIEKASPNLETEVIFAGLCAHCGACGTFCPHIEYQKDGVPKILDACNEVVGQCYNSCPRTSLNIPQLEQKMFGKTRKDEFLGYYEKAILVSSKKSILKALIESAFTISAVDSFIIPENQSKKPINNTPKLIKNTKKLPDFSSRNLDFTGPLITGVNDAYLSGLQSIGLIGNPCHFQGIAKMQYSDFRSGIKSQSLKIALMCAAGGATGCQYCIDYAGEFSDISYSDMGQEKGNAILLIRTPLGQKVVDQAVKSKLFAIMSESPDMGKILELAKKKKVSNIKNLLKIQNGKIGYLELNNETLNALF